VTAEPTTEDDSTLAVRVLYFLTSVLVAWIALMATPMLIGPIGGTTVLVVFLTTLVVSFAALLLMDARR
jgi:hypothetical protein